jgi:dinuclear metal center YbgI/SA1388 family protein
MVALSDIVSFLDELLDVGKHERDSNGLVIGGRESVKRTAGAVNLSLSCIKQAVSEGCDLLFTHHPAWRSTDAELVDIKHKLVRDAGLSLYVAHDSLDLHAEVGTAISLARVLNWEVEGGFLDGLGVLARPQGNASLHEIKLQIAEKVNPDVMVWGQQDSVNLVGIITGWGARPEWMRLARHEGADTFLSGEAMHFGKLYAQEVGMNLILAGHYATELPGVRSVVEKLGRAFDVETIILPDPSSAALF